MPARFDWQTDQEDAGWEDAPQHPRPQPARRRRWILLVTLVVLAIAGGLSYRQIAQHTTAVAADTRADVLSSHALLRQSATAQDRDLLLALLSGRDPMWTNATLQRLTSGTWSDRPGFDLTAGSASAAEPPTDVWLSPDLDAAAVQEPRPYTLQRGAGLTETVRLQETTFYRRGMQRWLLAPPSPDYWGSRQSRAGERLTLTYPERDADLAERLASDLDALLVALCGEVAQRCGAAWRLNLNLVVGDALKADQSLIDSATGFPTLSLPTPTLVGLPVDDAGYATLRAGYGRHVATAALADWSKFACCARGPILRAFVDGYLADLGYAPWPLRAAAFDALFQQRLIDRSADEGWLDESMGAGAAAGAHALVAFAEEIAPERTRFELIDDLSIYVTAWGWLDSLDGQADDRLSLRGDWLQFIGANTSWAATAVTPAPSRHAVEAICRNRVTRRLLLDVATGRWRTLERFDTSASPTDRLLDPLPGIAGYFVVDDGRVLFRHPRGDLPVLELPDADTGERLSLMPSGPHGDWLLLAYRQAGSQERQHWLLNPADCDAGSCRFTAVPGLPIWSPDGSRVLWNRAPGEAPEFWLSSDAYGRDALPQPAAWNAGAEYAFWLDDAHAGVVRFGSGGARELAVFDARTGVERARITAEDVADAAGVAASGIRLDHVVALQPGQIEVGLETAAGGRTVRVTLDATLTHPDTAVVWPDERPVQALAPDGQQAVRLRTGPPTSAILTDADGQVRASFPPGRHVPGYPGWSPDSVWYAETYRVGLLLVHAATGYQRIITYPPNTDCYRAAWVAGEMIGSGG